MVSFSDLQDLIPLEENSFQIDDVWEFKEPIEWPLKKETIFPAKL